ncbi:hypothetical protein HK102_005210 [Quaeritorhiza haematococci]|nr:hypothetical protein HK102_005210 [Quaeritorhiza haematococci]
MRLGTLRLGLLLSALASSAHAAPIAAPQADLASPAPCNGWPQLCSRRYTEVLFPMTHNSYAIAPGFPPPPAANQRAQWPISKQLLDGVRVFEWDLHRRGNAVHLCHGPCDEILRLPAGPLSGYVAEMKIFLERNPREVVTLMLENGADFDANTIAQEFADLIPFAHVQGAEWPTLGEMIESNKRLVVFTDSGADVQNHPWLLPALDWITSTDWAVTDLNNFNCDVYYPSGPRRTFTRLNHILSVSVTSQIYFPDITMAAKTNSKESLDAHINDCKRQGVSRPNFIAVDWGDTGDIFQVVAAENGLDISAAARAV